MRIRIALIIIPLLILALVLATGFTLVSRLFILMALVMLFSYIWTRLGLRGIAATVEKPTEHCQVGKWFDEGITLFNKSRLPKLFLRVQENTDLPDHHNAAIMNLSPRGSHSWQSKVYCRRRGRYSLGAFTVTAGDPFGLFSMQRKIGEPQTVLIYPETLELPFFQPLFHSEPGYGPSHWLISENSSSASRVREYAQNDSFKHIHWGSTAHTGKLMVKVFDPDRSNYASKDIWVILDMQQASHAGGSDGATEEYGVTIAASLIKKYIDNDKRVGLIASGDQLYTFLPQTGHQHLWSTLEALATMKATGTTPIDQVLQETEHFEVNPVLLVITPSTSEATISSLRRLKNRGAMVIAILIDSATFGGTVSAVNAANSLSSGGVQVYVIRQGEDLAKELDSRRLLPYVHAGGMPGSG